MWVLLKRSVILKMIRRCIEGWVRHLEGQVTRKRNERKWEVAARRDAREEKKLILNYQNRKVNNKNTSNTSLRNTDWNHLLCHEFWIPRCLAPRIWINCISVLFFTRNLKLVCSIFSTVPLQRISILINTMLIDWDSDQLEV